MSSIKEFNVKINGADSQTFNVGVDATNVDFSQQATDPFKNEHLEASVPDEMSNKASNIIYNNAVIRNNSPKTIDGTADNSEAGPNYKKALNGLSIEAITASHLSDPGGAFSISYGAGSLALGHNSMAIGFNTEAVGWASCAEGYNTVAAKACTHAEGAGSKASFYASHAEGDRGIAGGAACHSEGRGNEVYGYASHGEGVGNKIEASPVLDPQITEQANQINKQVELQNFKKYINGEGSHVEGISNEIKLGAYCHAQGINNVIGQVYGSTVMGEENEVSSNDTVVIGFNNKADTGSNYSFIAGRENENNGQPDSFVIGRYCSIEAGVNNDGTGRPAFVIGGGDSTTKSNLLTVRYPRNGKAASDTNKGSLWGKNVDAHFASVTTPELKGLKVITGTISIPYQYDSQLGKWTGLQFRTAKTYAKAFNGIDGPPQDMTYFEGYSKRLDAYLYYYPSIGQLHVYMYPFAGAAQLQNQNGKTAEIGNILYYTGPIDYYYPDDAKAKKPHPFQKNIPKEIIQFIGNGGGNETRMYPSRDWATATFLHRDGPFSVAYLRIQPFIMQWACVTDGANWEDAPFYGAGSGRPVFYMRFSESQLPIHYVKAGDYNIPNNISYQPAFHFVFHGKPVE